LLKDALWPEASGTVRKTKGEFTVDASNTDRGYFMAKRTATSSSLKMRVARGNGLYTYDLTADGQYDVFPLQMGDGTYTCSLYRNVSGNKYSKEAEVEFSVTLDEEFIPYLYPSQYVHYTMESEAVLMSEKICEGLQTDEEKYEAIIAYIRENFSYDYERARANPGFYLGDIEKCFKTRKGLCQDLAALAACMLRVQGIPTQMVIGYADKQYHAWNSVFIDNEYRHLDVTAEVTGVAAKVYTVDRWY